jgi:NhaP-type Na+/H+ and K+/H+ antiporter
MLLLLTFVALGTTLIWQGLSSIDWRIILFAVIAIIARPVVLYPMLKGLNLPTRDRRLIAAFGPRGLSSLLLALLPVFAGIPNAEQIFTITSVVVLLSVVVHGGGTAIFLRSSGLLGAPAPAGVIAPLNRAAAVAEPALANQVARSAEPAQLKSSEPAEEPAPLRITIDEMRALQAKAEPVIVVDARSLRSYDSDPLIATDAVRISPEDPVRDATEKRLSQRATLVVYCA